METREKAINENDGLKLTELYVRGIKINPIEEDCYYRDLPAIKHIVDMGTLPIKSKVTFLVGENGIGKSTLIEAIAVAMGFNPEGGTKNFSFSTNDSHSELHNNMTVIKGTRYPRDGFFLRAESLYNAASYIDEMDSEPSYSPPIIDSFGGISLHEQSHGESFLNIVENRFGGNGLYILDEPEAALSPNRLMRLLCNSKRLVDHNSQFIIATHSPILMTFPGADVLELTEEGIKKVSYKETEHYIITRSFLENPEKMLRLLFE